MAHMKWEEQERLFQEKGCPWNQVQGLKVPEETFHLYLETEESAKALEKRADEFQSLFGLSGSCRLIPSGFPVVARGFQVNKKTTNLEDKIKDLAKRTQVEIRTHFWRQIGLF